MARDEGAGAGSILLAFILGAVSGAAVALLYAPASGQRNARVSRREGARRRASARPRPPARAASPQPGPRNADHGHRSRPRSLSAGEDAGERVSDWSDVFLGIIAVATLATAVVQIGVLVAAGHAGQALGRLPDAGRARSHAAVRQPERDRPGRRAGSVAGDGAGGARRPPLRRCRAAPRNDA